jgi:hypothetical protein
MALSEEMFIQGRASSATFHNFHSKPNPESPWDILNHQNLTKTEKEEEEEENTVLTHPILNQKIS